MTTMRTEKEALAALQTAEGVHMAMLTGKIAKISMLQCAHTHGEDCVREYRQAVEADSAPAEEHR